MRSHWVSSRKEQEPEGNGVRVREDNVHHWATLGCSVLSSGQSVLGDFVSPSGRRWGMHLFVTACSRERLAACLLSRTQGAGGKGEASSGH